MDLPVVTQGRTLNEVADNVRTAIDLHLLDENLAEMGYAPDPSVLASFELDPSPVLTARYAKA